ncbi:MAG: membrane integrity-associated transporter subunit PqiC [Fibrobacteres bacterium]|nr:membrane integrity-associated transporter subunit PqiC [Fibrobacterota bacterium]
MDKVFLLLFLVILSGCSGKLKKEMIALRSDVAISTKQADSHPFRIQIRDIDPSRLADNQNVVVRKTDFTVAFERSAEWAVRPAAVLTDMIESEISSTVQCKSVRRRYSEAVPDLLTGGTLAVVEDDQRNGKRVVALKVRLQLTTKEEQTLIDKVYASEKPIDLSVKYTVFASVLNDLMKETAKAFAADVAKAVSLRADEKKHSEN